MHVNGFRVIPACLALLITGCAATQTHIGYCSVFKLLGGKSAPLGLVTLPPDLESKLRLQLGPQMGKGYLCWYVSGAELIAAERANPKSFVYGAVFHRAVPEGEWTHRQDDVIILAVPNTIE